MIYSKYIIATRSLHQAQKFKPHRLYCLPVAGVIPDRCVHLQTDKDKLNDSYAALERKAALYEKLSQGRFDDDEEQYNVDFLQKGFLIDEMHPHNRPRPAHDPAEPIDSSAMAIRASGVPLDLPLYLP